MKKLLISFCFALLFSVACSQLAFAGYNMNNMQEVEMELNIGSTMVLEETSSNSKIEYVKAILFLYPMETFQQEVRNLKITPQTEENDSSLIYTWQSPSQDILDFSLKADVTGKNSRIKVTNKVPYPLRDVGDAEIYTQSTEMIDSDIKMVADKASELAEGETDTFLIAVKLAEWVKTNVEYDLSSQGANAVKKASWVLTHRNGVCDEITNLFIAMCRALGIPARYVSGVAYTDFGDKNNWGNHAWAEVYLPDYGWIPFDVTYGQFGYVDPSHIILKYSLDSNEPSTNYEWRGVNVNLKSKPIDINVDLLSKIAKQQDIVSFESNVLHSTAGFGSYNLIETKIRNLADYYVAEEFLLSKPEELSLIGKESQTVLLRPNEQKTIYWIVKLDSYLNRDFVYTMPIGVYTQKNSTSMASFKSSYKDTVYSKEEIESEIENTGEEKNYNYNVEMSCNSTKSILLLHEKDIINCSLRNYGNSAANGLAVCLASDCKTISLAINQEESLEFDYTPNAIGRASVIITAKNDKISASDALVFEVVDMPQIEIANIEKPNEVSFGETYTVSFVLDKKSFSDPQDIQITIDVNGAKNYWKIDSMDQDRKINVNLKANSLDEGDNPILIEVKHKDIGNSTITKTAKSSIRMREPNFFQKMQILFNKLGYWLEGFVRQ